MRQALLDEGKANWATLELRHSRVDETFARAVFAGVRNLCVIGGDAHSVLPRRMKAGTFAAVCVNHPEPPRQRGGEHCQRCIFERQTVEGLFDEGRSFRSCPSCPWRPR